jgi:hypothetical protein
LPARRPANVTRAGAISLDRVLEQIATAQFQCFLDTAKEVEADDEELLERAFEKIISTPNRSSPEK